MAFAPVGFGCCPFEGDGHVVVVDFVVDSLFIVASIVYGAIG